MNEEILEALRKAAEQRRKLATRIVEKAKKVEVMAPLGSWAHSQMMSAFLQSEWTNIRFLLEMMAQPDDAAIGD